MKAESYSTKDLFIWAIIIVIKIYLQMVLQRERFFFTQGPRNWVSFAFQFYKEIQKYSLKIIYHHDLFLFLICGGVVFSFIKWRKFKKCSGGRITLELVLKMTAPLLMKGTRFSLKLVLLVRKKIHCLPVKEYSWLAKRPLCLLVVRYVDGVRF